MPRRLDEPNSYGGTTDHSDLIDACRQASANVREERGDDCFAWVQLLLVADLLEMHDQTGLVLDDWWPARQFVEKFIDQPILESGV